MTDARDELESTTLSISEGVDYDDKQQAREVLCREIIDLVHEDVAWNKAMEKAAEYHRRDDFPCFPD